MGASTHSACLANVPWHGRVDRWLRRWPGGSALLLVLVPMQAPAQQPWAARLGLGADFWRLDPGTLGQANTRIGPAAQLVLERGHAARGAAMVTIGFAPQADFTPGLFSAAVEGIARLLPHSRGTPNVHVGFGVGAMFFNAANAERAIRDCTPERLCLFEGVAFASGARLTAIGRAGAELPVGRATLLPAIELWQRVGSGRAGPAGVSRIWRFGLGVVF